MGARLPRLHALVREQGLAVVGNAADLASARSSAPSVLVAAEGTDFLEGEIGLLDVAYERAALRHLQLTHDRVNERGDIQTEALVRGVAAVATKPIVLSHTSLTTRPPPRTRRVTPEHARIVAGTGGIVGVWPPASLFPDLAALAGGIARTADAIGPAHVGIGTDTMGLVGPNPLDDHARLPELASLLLGRLSPEETAGILGGNSLRVARACLAA